MAKLPYEKPVIVHEEVIQTAAGPCIALPGGGCEPSPGTAAS
jgi:hypothetical protein